MKLFDAVAKATGKETAIATERGSTIAKGLLSLQKKADFYKALYSLVSLHADKLSSFTSKIKYQDYDVSPGDSSSAKVAIYSTFVGDAASFLKKYKGVNFKRSGAASDPDATFEGTIKTTSGITVEFYVKPLGKKLDVEISFW